MVMTFKYWNQCFFNQIVAGRLSQKPYLVRYQKQNLLYSMRAKLEHIQLQIMHCKIKHWYGGSPGLVVLGGGSCSEDCGFKPQHCKPYVHFQIYLL